MKKYFLPVFFAVVILITPLLTFATDPIVTGCHGPGGSCNLQDICPTIGRTVSTIITVVNILAVAFIIFGGLLFITSGESPERREQGKKALIATIIGLLLIYGAWGIITLILSTLGVVNPLSCPF